MSAELRPSFQIDLPALGVDEVVARLRAGLDPASFDADGVRTDKAGHRWVTEWAKTHVLVAMRKDLRHAWSPWLHVDVRSSEAGETYVFARFSPHPALWTAIALTYLALGSIVLFGACFGTAQAMLGERGWAWWVVGAAVVVAGLIWIASQAGQRLAREQMAELHAALDRALDGALDGALA